MAERVTKVDDLERAHDPPVLSDSDVATQALELIGLPSDEFSSLARTLCAADPVIVVKELKANGSDKDVFRFLRIWLKEDVLPATEWIDLLQGQRRSGLQVIAVEQMLAQGLPREAESFVSELSGTAQKQGYSELLKDSFNRTGSTEDAERILDTLPIGRLRRDLTATVATYLGGSDLNRGIDWVARLPDDEKNAAASALSVLIRSPEELAEPLRRENKIDATIANALLHQYASRQNHSDETIEETIRLAVANGLSGEVESIVSSALSVWRQNDPESMANYVSMNINQPYISQKTVSLAVTELLNQQPEDAIHWTTRDLPEQYAGREAAIAQAVDGWYSSNSLELSTWLANESTLRPDERSVIVGRLVVNLKRSGDEEAAAAWSQELRAD